MITKLFPILFSKLYYQKLKPQNKIHFDSTHMSAHSLKNLQFLFKLKTSQQFTQNLFINFLFNISNSIWFLLLIFHSNFPSQIILQFWHHSSTRKSWENQKRSIKISIFNKSCLHCIMYHFLKKKRKKSTFWLHLEYQWQRMFVYVLVHE